MGSLESFERFVAAINGHDVEAIGALMAMEHVFVDSMGHRVQGAGSMIAGWRGYFSMCPDYWLRVDYVMGDGDRVMAAGEAGGTIDGVPWKTPAAWQALIDEGKVVEWRVFADNKPVYEILGRRARG